MAKKKTDNKYHSTDDFTKITSIGHLRGLAKDADTEVAALYTKLTRTAASNLGMPNETLDIAIRSLIDTANETTEEGVVDEINFVRNCVKR